MLRRQNSVRLAIWAILTGLPGTVTAQILDTQVLETPPVLDPVEDVVRQVERAAERAAEQGLDTVEDADTLVEPVNDTFDSLSLLPERLPIMTLNGNPAFVDVAVENGFRAVERQWLVMVQPGELALLEQIGAEILEQTPFESLDLTLLRFRVDDALDSRDALRQVLPPELVDRLDRNHIYSPQKDSSQKENVNAGFDSRVNHCELPVRIGMVDTAIQRDHPAFAEAKLNEKSFLGDALEQPHAHGTAVAGLFVGSDGERPPRLPRATLYNASVFYARNEFAQGATMMHLVKGLDWLLQNDVGVINMSLTGPDNQILAAVIDRVINRGKVVVAAAGNGGPAAPPLFPAAYSDVIAATAVDADYRIYRWANRGDYVDFAAPGVSVLTARSDGRFGRESGTSMAAPVVSALVACELAANGGKRTAAIDALVNQALDLGDSGRDPVFGYGLLR